MKKKSLIFLSLILSGSLFAQQNAFIQKEAKVFANSSAKAQAGKIEIATPVEVLETKANLQKVKLIGWSAYGFENVLFKDVGQRVIYAALDEKVAKKAKVISSKTDDYDTQWNQVSYELWIKKDTTTKNIENVWSVGKELFTNRCGACHASPELTHYTTNQWPGVINSMKSRAGLTDEEMQMVTKFVQNNAK